MRVLMRVMQHCRNDIMAVLIRKKIGMKERKTIDCQEKLLFNFFVISPGWIVWRIDDILFNLLGLDTEPCRRRFICEMEFRARTHLLTRFSYQFLVHTLFSPYLDNRDGKTLPKTAQTFAECATFNAQCQFIENNPKSNEAIQNKNDRGERREGGGAFFPTKNFIINKDILN